MPLLWLCYPIETIQSSEPVSGVYPKDKNNIINKNQDWKVASRCKQAKIRTLAAIIKKEGLLPVWFPIRERFNEGF